LGRYTTRPRARYPAHDRGGQRPALSGPPDEAAPSARDVAIRGDRRVPRVPGSQIRWRCHTRGRGRWGWTAPCGRHALRRAARPCSGRATRWRSRHGCPRLKATPAVIYARRCCARQGALGPAAGLPDTRCGRGRI